MNRISRIIVSVMMFLPMLHIASAQTSDNGKVRFAYDVAYEMDFDNREFYKSRFSRSMTIFGARLTPSIGISIHQHNDVSHKVMVGVDVMKNFGASPVSSDVAGPNSSEILNSLNNRDLFGEISLYYKMEKKAGDNTFLLQTGVFPRSSMEGEYSEAFFSDSLKFYDNNIEGLLLKLRRPKSYFELGCDWMGQYGVDRRERFMVFSSGEGRVVPWVYLGYSAYMYHFADSRTVHGVVDNILINPYLRADFSSLAGLQKLGLRAGWLQALQHDRANVGHYVFPGGGEIEAEVRNWNVGLKNRLYIGSDIMPYYNSKDAGNYKYGSRLYMGDPFYRVYDDGTAGVGTYDRLEAYYEPRMGRSLKIRLAAIFHFNNMRYSGTQQMVVLKFDLQELMRANDNR